MGEPAKTKFTKRALPKLDLKRENSFVILEDLIQCGICLEKLSDGRMLPCQHTFCRSCLQSQLLANSLLTTPDKAGEPSLIRCPICQHKLVLEKGAESLNELPKNLYIDSLLRLVEDNVSPIAPRSPDYRCVKCKTFSQHEGQVCQHCMKIFCNVCWTEHLSELEINLSTLITQVDESKTRLGYKLENFENRCDQLLENIKVATLQKIDVIKMAEESALRDVSSISCETRKTHQNISNMIEQLKDKLSLYSQEKTNHKVATFMQLHKETSKVLTQVNTYGEARIIFDPESFRLEQESEGIYHDTDETQDLATARNYTTNPLQSQDDMVMYYKNKQFSPKLVWNRCPRPGHVASPPWDPNIIYVAATDTHIVLIFDKSLNKLVGRLTSPQNMLYPQSIAFSETLSEIYISDKWQHCIHVFAKSGDYLRSILSKGNGNGRVRSPHGLAMGPKGELIISDSGNDRIIVVNPQTGQHLSTIGIVGNKTLLNMPMGLAVIDDRVIVADTGNHNVKIFNMEGTKLGEFGTLGRERGQFRSAEVVAVDPQGLILVGDGGNARIQVFKSDGRLVRIFGGVETVGFKWVSGIFVTKELDIITTDNKSRSLRIF